MNKDHFFNTDTAQRSKPPRQTLLTGSPAEKIMYGTFRLEKTIQKQKPYTFQVEFYQDYCQAFIRSFRYIFISGQCLFFLLSLFKI